jgi:hypothetical protein
MVAYATVKGVKYKYYHSASDFTVGGQPQGGRVVVFIMTKDYPEHCFTTIESIAACPKCLKRFSEFWLTHKKNGKERLRKKRHRVVCLDCNFDLSKVKHPKGKLIVKL